MLVSGFCIRRSFLERLIERMKLLGNIFRFVDVYVIIYGFGFYFGGKVFKRMENN